MKSVRWKRHKTPKSALRAFSAGMKLKLEDLCMEATDGSSHSAEDLVASIARQGLWGFTQTKLEVPVIHYWHDGKRTREDLAFLFGHELGHNFGKKLKGDLAEEARADEYGEAVVLALRRSGLEKYCRNR